MKLENLKTGLFGYKKSSVFQLISSIEEEYSDKLMLMHSQAMKNEEQQLMKIRQLEEELKDVKKQLKKLRNRHTGESPNSQRYIKPSEKDTDIKEQEALRMLNNPSDDNHQKSDEIENDKEHKHETAENESSAEQNMLLFTRKTKSLK